MESKETKKYKHCQSCGMPMNMDKIGGGTEKDGSKSNRFCSHCYLYGEFTHPDINTADKMKEVVATHIQEAMHLPRFLAKFFARNIHKLERWQNLPK